MVSIRSALGSRWRVYAKRGAGLLLVVLILLGIYLALRFTSDVPVVYGKVEDHFAHGSTGGEIESGIPYWIWVALPELFPEHLPDGRPGRGYASFGMIYEPGADPRFALPIGVSEREVQGVDRVYLNCAACHTGSVRDRPGAEARIVLGMPANTFDLGRWGRFLFDCATDQKFTPERMLSKIGEMSRWPGAPPRLDVINRALFKFAAVYLMRERLLMLRDRLSFVDGLSWGPGRVDTFNAPKALLNFRMDGRLNRTPDARELVGNADFPAIWHQGKKRGMHLHWDGNNDKVEERNLSAAFGTGAFPPTVDHAALGRLERWLQDAGPTVRTASGHEALRYPYPIDAAKAAAGAPLYRRYCALCHGRSGEDFQGGLVGQVTPLAQIGTDRSRLDSYTPLLAVNQNTLYAGTPYRFSRFRKTWGYANAPLDGLWLRAPYLHNGSVPTLRDLLNPA